MRSNTSPDISQKLPCPDKPRLTHLFLKSSNPLLRQFKESEFLTALGN